MRRFSVRAMWIMPAVVLCALSARLIAAQDAPARVIVTLRDPVALTAPADLRADAVAALNADLAPTLDALNVEVLARFAQVPGLVARMTPDAVAALESDPRVLAVMPDLPGGAHSDDSRPAIGADAARTQYNLTGAGVRVAVLDSGVNLTHPDLADSIVAQVCFTGGSIPNEGSCPPGDTLTGTSALDGNGHGTNVTGIITSNGTTAPRGFAPDAEIVAIRILDNTNYGWVSDWILGLDWLIANQETLRVDVVNMSVGSFALFQSDCDSQLPSLALAIDILRDYWNVPTFASTGNNGEPYLTAAPSCMSGAIGVGASYDSDMGREPDTQTWGNRFAGWPACFDNPTGIGRLACFSNGGSNVDLVAPGVYITSTGRTNPTSRYAGTSQAAPTASGVAALMLQARPALSADAIEAILKETGVPLADHRGNGFTYPRINALAAVERVLTLLNSPVQIAPINRAVTPDTPEWVWSAVDGAQAYNLWVSRASDSSRVFNLWLDPAQQCNATECRFTSPFPLTSDVYRWWVLAWDSTRGESPWAGLALFTVP